MNKVKCTFAITEKKELVILWDSGFLILDKTDISRLKKHLEYAR